MKIDLHQDLVHLESLLIELRDLAQKFTKHHHLHALPHKIFESTDHIWQMVPRPPLTPEPTPEDPIL